MVGHCQLLTCSSYSLGSMYKNGLVPELVLPRAGLSVKNWEWEERIKNLYSHQGKVPSNLMDSCYFNSLPGRGGVEL